MNAARASRQERVLLRGPPCLLETHGQWPQQPAVCARRVVPVGATPGAEELADESVHEAVHGGGFAVLSARGSDLDTVKGMEYIPSTSPVRPGVPDSIVEGLNAPQAEAVTTLEGPLLVVAGPGSGKTRVLTHRVAALLATGTPPWKILAVTFTNKAAAEMRERLELLVGEEQAQKLWVTTFHSLCARLLRRFHEEAGLDKSFSIADSDDARKLVTAALKGRGMNPEDARTYTSAISWAKNNLHTPSSMESDLPDAAKIFADYQSALAQQRLVDFDDLLVRTYLLLRDNADVRAAAQDRFGYVMVDEYQDTNRVQYEIVRLISSEHHNLCVVGDTDQSIYAFRGAFPAAIGGFAEDFPGAAVIILNQNYRSSQAVLATARALIAKNPAVHRADLWTANDPGAPVRVIEFDDDRQEATWVINQLSSHTGTSAIIVRTNAQTRPFEAALTAARIPYVVVGTQRFYDRAEVKDALSWLRLALNPADLPAIRRAVAMPRRGLGEKTLGQLVTAAEVAGIDPIAAASRPDLLGVMTPRLQNICAQFAADVATVRTAAERTPAAALETVLALGMREALETEPDRLENLSQLTTAAALYVAPPEDPFLVEDPNATAGIPGEPEGLAITRSFLETAALASTSDNGTTASALTSPEGQPPPPPVSLTTAHAAKGREFDNVFVAGVEETVYPHVRTQDDPQGIAEERRLLFVAASRPRHHLVLSWCRRRMQFGKWADSGPSPFLVDLPDEVLQSCLASERSPDIFARRSGYGGSGSSWSGNRSGGNRSGGYGQSGSRPSSPSASSSANRLPPGRPASERPPPAASVAPVVPLAAAVLTAGVHVEHPVFGTGVVIGDATETKVVISFSGTKRTMMIAFSPLTLAA